MASAFPKVNLTTSSCLGFLIHEQACVKMSCCRLFNYSHATQQAKQRCMPLISTPNKSMRYNLCKTASLDPALSVKQYIQVRCIASLQQGCAQLGAPAHTYTPRWPTSYYFCYRPSLSLSGLSCQGCTISKLAVEVWPSETVHHLFASRMVTLQQWTTSS
jgi:hypothetical protein